MALYNITTFNMAARDVDDTDEVAWDTGVINYLLNGVSLAQNVIAVRFTHTNVSLVLQKTDGTSAGTSRGSAEVIYLLPNPINKADPGWLSLVGVERRTSVGPVKQHQQATKLGMRINLTGIVTQPLNPDVTAVGWRSNLSNSRLQCHMDVDGVGDSDSYIGVNREPPTVNWGTIGAQAVATLTMGIPLNDYLDWWQDRRDQAGSDIINRLNEAGVEIIAGVSESAVNIMSELGLG